MGYLSRLGQRVKSISSRGSSTSSREDSLTSPFEEKEEQPSCPVPSSRPPPPVITIPDFADGSEGEKERARFVREEYLAWLEWRVADMTPPRRCEFLAAYAGDDLWHTQAVLAYLTVHPDHMSPDETNSEQSVLERRGMDPEMNPIAKAAQIEAFPRVAQGFPVFGLRVNEWEEDVGPKDESPLPLAVVVVDDGSTTPTPPQQISTKKRRRDSGPQGVVEMVRVGRYMVKKSVWLGLKRPKVRK